MSKIQETIRTYEQKIESQNDKGKHEDLYKSLDISIIELTTYQNAKSVLFASGLISLDVANYLYRKLRDYANTSLAERIVLTLLFKEMLERKMRMS